jgi:multiple sugar transport system ATP-binding protein
VAEIRFLQATRTYPGTSTPAVDALDIEIANGELMVLVGPSGSGKTTALRMLAGLEEVDTGAVLIGGRDVTDLPPKKRDVAMVFQNYALYPYLTVADNIGFPLRMAKVKKADRAARVQEVAELLGLSEFLQRKPGQLSGGQRQRVALGRALVRDPVAFLLDEPLSNLDAKLRASMRTELVKLHRQLGRTIIHVTHDQVEAMTMGERICIMKDGVIVQVGAPMEVYRNPVDTFVAGFLASPPMNLLSGSLLAKSVRLGDVELPLPQALSAAFASHSGQDVIVGLRPEDFHLKADTVAMSVALEIMTVATEVLGPEVILVGNLRRSDEAEIHIRCSRDFRSDPGAVTMFYYDLSQLQIFDAETTHALKRPLQI